MRGQTWQVSSKKGQKNKIAADIIDGLARQKQLLATGRKVIGW